MDYDTHGQRLRIAYIVGAFPVLSETFIVNQIAAVAARGHAVDIYVTCEGTTACVIPRGLAQRMHRLYASSNRFLAIARTLGLAMFVSVTAPATLLRFMQIVLRDGPRGSLRLLYAACTLARRGMPHYDVIHAQFGVYAPLALRLVEIGVLSGAVVTSLRGYDIGKHAPIYSDDLFRQGALFLPVSRALARRLIEIGCDPAKVRVLHSGVECRQLPFRERSPGTGDLSPHPLPSPGGRGGVGSLARFRVERPTACTKLVTVARLVEKKGIRYAIEAVARVVASGRAVSYTIVGDGPLRAGLMRLIEALGISAHIHLTGAQPHEAALCSIDASDILIAPSVAAADGDEEGIPNAIKEAMAMGLPVVGTLHGGIAELVEDGISGFLVPERDVDRLTERLIDLIDHPGRWPAFGRAGRQRVEREFDIDRLSDELVGLYRCISDGKKFSSSLSVPTWAHEVRL